MMNIGIMIPIFIILHLVSAGRKIPVRFRDQRVVWQVAFRTGHKDTISWIWQVISGMAILVLVMVHIAAVTFAPGVLHLNAAGTEAVVHSFERMQSWYWLLFYGVLLVIGETHASVGLYRQFIKWGVMKRGLASMLSTIATVGFISLGAVALVFFAITSAAEGATTVSLDDLNIPSFFLPHGH